MAIIQLENVSKIFGQGESKIDALKEVSFSVEKGEMVAVMGRSGSGKSTLMNIIGCLDTVTSGKYLLHGKDISLLTQNNLAGLRGNCFGFVVQHFALIDDYTVYENIMVPLTYTPLKANEKKQKALSILEKLDILDKKNKYPCEISGGQCQRTAIARALVNDPDIILADEPTGSVDKNTGICIIDIFKNLNIEGKTIIIVTHDEDIAAQCQKLIKIEDGKII